MVPRLMAWRPGALLALVASAVVAPAAPAQERGRSGGDWCREWDERERGWHCEVREVTLAARQLLAVDAAPNGGIKVTGWDRNEIVVRARVAAQADSDEDAERLVEQVRLETDGRWIRAEGPQTRRRRSWWVSYEIMAPRTTHLELESQNGGIGLEGMGGRSEIRTVNGGIHLDGVAGHVRGRTTNGGLRIDLTGERFQGEGLDVQTTNGGVRLTIPSDYSARLETGTVNGGVEIDFPVMVQGRISRRLSLDLGEGGPLIRAVTTNGGVVIRRP